MVMVGVYYYHIFLSDDAATLIRIGRGLQSWWVRVAVQHIFSLYWEFALTRAQSCKRTPRAAYVVTIGLWLE